MPVAEPWSNVFDSAGLNRSRRQFLAGASAVALAATLGACGSGDDGRADAGSHTVEDVFGKVKVPNAPKRIVAADEITTANLLALGVQPVGGVYFSRKLSPYLTAHVIREIPNVYPPAGLDYEQILSLNPDLVLMTGDEENEKACKRLKGAATTVCYRLGFSPKADTFRNLRELAAAINRSDRAEAVIDRYEARIAELKPIVAKQGWESKRVVLLYVDGGPANMYLMNTSLGTFVLDDLGIPRRKGKGKFFDQVSLERLGILDEFFAVIAYNWGGGAVQEKIESNALWQNLDVVSAGRVAWTEGPAWYGQDMLAALQITSDVQELLLPLSESS